MSARIFLRLMAGVVCLFLLVPVSLEFLHIGILWGMAVAFLAATLLAALLARSLARGFATVLGDAAETAEKLRNTVEQLQRERSEIERVERVRKDFVINVSHELRTPLASIQGYAETLMDGALNDPAYNMRFLAIIRHNAERLARITQDLLTLSRVEQKRQKFEFEPFSVNGLLKQAIELMRPMAEKGEIRLELEPGPAEACVWCDGEAVSQILSNLLDNAIKYTPAGGRITVGAESRRPFCRNCTYATPESAFPPRNCPAFSSAFIASTKPARASWAAPAWGSRSSNTWWRRTTEPRAWKAARARAPRSFSPSPWTNPSSPPQQLNPEFTTP